MGSYLLCAAVFLFLTTYNHVKIVGHAWPLDYQETGMLAITATIAEGGNPFALEQQPINISLYPVAYNLLMAPVSRVSGNTLFVHRLVAGLFIIASCTLCFLLCRKASGAREDSFVAALLLYCVLLHYSTPIASPNGLGLFLFLAAITIPWLSNFSRLGLALSIVLGTLAFFTKQYFIAALGYIALYLFLAKSKKLAIYYGLVAGAAVLACTAVVVHTSPYYLDNTIFAQQAGARTMATDEKVWGQFKDYLTIYYPLLAIPFISAVYLFRGHERSPGKRETGSRSLRRLHLKDFNQPLLSNPPDYLWTCMACSVIIFALLLGKNPGNHLTYLFQLVSPFLLAAFLGRIAVMENWRWVLRAAALLTLYNSYSLLPTDFSVKRDNWLEISEEISKAENIYASTLVLQQIMEEGKAFYHNGHTSYFPLGQFKPSVFVKENPEETVAEIWETHVELIESKIINKEFDLIVIDNWMNLPRTAHARSADPRRALDENYVLVADVPLHLLNRLGAGVFKVRIYKPEKSPPAGNNQKNL